MSKKTKSKPKGAFSAKELKQLKNDVDHFWDKQTPVGYVGKLADGSYFTTTVNVGPQATDEGETQITLMAKTQTELHAIAYHLFPDQDFDPMPVYSRAN